MACAENRSLGRGRVSVPVVGLATWQRLGAAGRGGIVLTSALGASQGLPNMAHDSAAKAYALDLGEALHYELAPAGVDVIVMPLAGT